MILRVPVTFANAAAWGRQVATALNAVIARQESGYPYLTAVADPADPQEGFTYYNLTSHKVRTWNGTAWADHF